MRTESVPAFFTEIEIGKFVPEIVLLPKLIHPDPKLVCKVTLAPPKEISERQFPLRTTFAFPKLGRVHWMTGLPINRMGSDTESKSSATPLTDARTHVPKGNLLVVTSESIEPVKEPSDVHGPFFPAPDSRTTFPEYSDVVP
jgi:hypothetical protein